MMRLHKSFIKYVFLLFFLTLFGIYYIMDTKIQENNLSEMWMSSESVLDLENKIKVIESEINLSNLTLRIIKVALADVYKSKHTRVNAAKVLEYLSSINNKDKQARIWKALQDNFYEKQNNVDSNSIFNFSFLLQRKCFSNNQLKTDIKMMDLYIKLKFDNPDGGAWKQGYPINYNKDVWSPKNKLHVIIVPHSHNDPGWLNTFEDYFHTQTRLILDNMLSKLQQYPSMRFIYAEMSYFHLWWKGLSVNNRKAVQRLLANGQLEIVTGGWVMNDEANTHYYAMIDQLIEGHQFLAKTVGFYPNSSWAIDPFGHSSTMAYLLKRSGFKFMVIQRVHYAVKKYLAHSRQLEFTWMQSWDTTPAKIGNSQSSNSGIFCHLMPFYSYDIPHTCGPDPKICCQFDFLRLPGSRVNCPWNVPPVAIDKNNLHERAFSLLDQYRKKATLYHNNVVLVPLGDDFRYANPSEWDNQFLNYRLLLDYMNSQSDWNVDAKFGTLSDYMRVLENHASAETTQYPTFQGDLFTYADRDDHYWSGYYTSRPFYKRFDRVLEGTLRAADILFGYALLVANSNGYAFPKDEIYERLTIARRALDLFQHHDGVTGTAKVHVVQDYGEKMLQSLHDSRWVSQRSIHFLLSSEFARLKYKEERVDYSKYFLNEDMRPQQDLLPIENVLQLESDGRRVPQRIILFNSLLEFRNQLVTVYTSQSHVEVRDKLGYLVFSQVDPVFLNNEDISESTFLLHFEAKMEPLSLNTFTIRALLPNETNVKHNVAGVVIYNSPGGALKMNVFTVERRAPEDFALQTNFLKVTFSQQLGTLTSIQNRITGVKTESRIKFVNYGVTSAREKSGAYLFLPDGDAKALVYDPPIMRVVGGSLIQEVRSFLPNTEHSTKILNTPDIEGHSIHLTNIVDIRNKQNYELAMRLETNVLNQENEFYTDLNCFQMTRRQYFAKLPLQANVYPMPCAAYLEDNRTRVTLLSGQAAGISAMRLGRLEVMLDRRLSQDDNRGLGQGVLDNKRTASYFRVLIEARLKNTIADVPDNLETGLLSGMARLNLLQLQHPLYRFPLSSGIDMGESVLSRHLQLMTNKSLPCGLHLVTLKSLPEKVALSDSHNKPGSAIGFVIHQWMDDCQYAVMSSKCTYDVSSTVQQLFANVRLKKIQRKSLTFTHDELMLQPSTSTNNILLNVSPMELQSFEVEV